MTRLAAALAALIAVALACTDAQAAPFTVTKTADTNDGVCGSDCSLREAIVAANANGQADTITVPAGTYTLTIPGADEDASATGDLDITSDMTIIGAGATSTIIDATGVGDRVFDETAGPPIPTASISDLTIKGGHPPNATDDGGGVHANGNVNLDRVVLSGNTVGGEGGGAVEDGGGVGATATLVRIRNSLVTGNTASVGGGVSENGGARSTTADAGVVIEDSTVSGNVATDPGGGVGGGVVEDGGGDLHIRRSTISGNTATGPASGQAFGGGLATDGGGTTEVVNTTITGNTADGTESWGGGYAEGGGGIVTITNTTIAGNSVTGSGTTPKHQAAGVGQAGAGEVTFKNTIVTGSPRSCAEDTPSSGTFTSAGNNIDGDNTCFFNAGGDQPGVDPKLGPLADNGGPTQTLALLPGSPAIDHGDLASCPSTDQRGVARPQPAGGACDIGAYELIEADLSVSGTLSASQVNVGGQVTDAITVRNTGPSPADGVTLGVALPAGLTAVGTGGCSGTQTLSCTLGTVPAGGSVTITLALRADSAGQKTRTATVAAGKDIVDPNAGNNSTTATLTAVAPALKPTRGSTVLAAPVKGIVRVSVPIARAVGSAGLPRGATAVKPPRGFSRFTRLTAGTLVPVRSVFDTTRGTVKLTTARDAAGTSLQSGTFRSGTFRVTQSRSSPLTTMTLFGVSFSSCRSSRSRGASAARRRPRNSLFSNVRGRFRTRGRNSTASVRGTQWLTKDTCAGTLTVVRRGSVTVRDLVKRRTIVVRAGHKYLARPRKR